MPIPIIIGLQNMIGYPTCIGEVCKACKSECLARGLKWNTGGEKCFNSCKNKLLTENKVDAEQLNKLVESGGLSQESKSPNALIWIGGLVILALLVVFLMIVFKNRKK